MIPQGILILFMVFGTPVLLLFMFLMAILLKVSILPLIPLPLWFTSALIIPLSFWLGFFTVFETIIFVQRVRGELTLDEHRYELKNYSWALGYLLLGCAWEVGFYLLLEPVSGSVDLLKTYLFVLVFVFFFLSVLLVVVWNARQEKKEQAAL